jgi:integrase
VFASGEVKNRESLEYPLPPESVALLETYLSQFRPALAPSGNTALFPGQGRTRKHVVTLRDQIGKAVFSHTGLRVHPHLFRHVGAKLFLERNPGSYE